MRDKLGRFTKGHKPIFTIKIKRKISKALKGFKHSSKSKKNMSKGRKKYLKNNPIPTGKKSPHWKNGITKHSEGYVLIYQPFHPRAIRQYVKRCYLVMEKHLGRYLKPEEIVHHINHIKTDDRLKNLQLTTQSEHIKIHNPLQYRWGKHQKI